jgi:D-glycero-beta-D-manno-heptose-7-phosphate kinase
MTIPQIFEGFNKLNVLIIGDLMVDSYVWGIIERMSPEAPAVPVVKVEKREMRLGGAGNVAMNIKALGANPIICSVIGNDSVGDAILSIFDENKLLVTGILKSKDRITTVKERIIAEGKHQVRVDSEMDILLNEEDRQNLTRKIIEQSENIDVIIFQDYDKGVISKTLIEEIIEFAQSKKIPVVVDPKKRNFLFYKNATIFKPNLKEIKDGLNIQFDSKNPTEVEKVVDLLKNKLNIEGAFLTLSEKGVYIDYLGQKVHMPAFDRNIIDVSGAGDTVISIAACCVALGLTPHVIANLSNLGGGLVCEKVGVVPIDKDLLLAEATLHLEA